MKTVILGIEGVLTSAARGRSIMREKRAMSFEDTINPHSIDALNRVTSETNASLIVSGSWVRNRTVYQIDTFLHKHGVVATTVGKLPTEIPNLPLNRWCTARFVQMWLDRQKRIRPGEGISLVILNSSPIGAQKEWVSDSAMSALFDRHLQTSPEKGLTAQQAQQAITLLRRDLIAPAAVFTA